jgi:hypothetical protein
MNTTTSLRDAVAEYARRSLTWMQEWLAAELAESVRLEADGYRLVRYLSSYAPWHYADGTDCGYLPRRLAACTIWDFRTGEVLGELVAGENETLSLNAEAIGEWERNHWRGVGGAPVPDEPPFADLALTEAQASDVIDLVLGGCVPLITALSDLTESDVLRFITAPGGTHAGDREGAGCLTDWLIALAAEGVDPSA